MSRTSKTAYQNVAAFINETRNEKVRLVRDMTNTIELDRIKRESETALTWLGVMTKYIEKLESMVNGEQLAMFDTSALSQPKQKKSKEKAVQAY
jgi:hypothetical protein